MNVHHAQNLSRQFIYQVLWLYNDGDCVWTSKLNFLALLKKHLMSQLHILWIYQDLNVTESINKLQCIKFDIYQESLEQGLYKMIIIEHIP